MNVKRPFYHNELMIGLLLTIPLLGAFANLKVELCYGGFLYLFFKIAKNVPSSFLDFLKFFFTWKIMKMLMTVINLDIYPLDMLLLSIFLVMFFDLSYFKKSIEISLSYGIRHYIKLMAWGGFYSTLIVGWYVMFGDDIYSHRIPNLSPILMIFGILGFSVFNAIGEELLFRGVLPSVVKFTGEIPTLIIQANWFAWIHYKSGFPRGFLGVIITFTLGLHLYRMASKKGGFIDVCIVHFIVDLAIISTVTYFPTITISL